MITQLKLDFFNNIKVILIKLEFILLIFLE